MSENGKRASGNCAQNTVMMKCGTEFSWETVCSLGTYANSAAFSNSFCCNGVTLPENFGANPTPVSWQWKQAQMMTGCKLSLSRKARRRGKGKHPNQKGTSHETNTSNTSPTDTNTCKNCGQNWTLGERLLETRLQAPTTIPPGKQQPHAERQEPQERHREKQTRGRCGKRISFLKTPSTVPYPSQNTENNWRTLVQFKFGNRGSWVWTINSRVKLVQSIFLLDSGAQLHACPIKYPGQKA